LTNLQSNVFVFDAQIGGQVLNGLSGSNRPGMPAMGLAGVTVQLLDQTGAVIDSVVTDPTGHYRFIGVQIGDYTIGLTLADGKQVTPKFDIHITRGGPVNDVNIAVPPPAHTSPPQPMHPSSPPSLQPVTMGLINRPTLHLM